MKSGYHSVYNIKFHLVLVTKYRNKCLNKQIIDELNLIFTDTCDKWEVSLLEFGAEQDHVHLLIDFNPTIQPSKFVNNLKTVSSRLVRKKFQSHLSQFYWKPVLWSRSYCLVSTGGAPLEVIKKYIENQNSPK